MPHQLRGGIGHRRKRLRKAAQRVQRQPRLLARPPSGQPERRQPRVMAQVKHAALDRAAVADAVVRRAVRRPAGADAHVLGRAVVVVGQKRHHLLDRHRFLRTHGEWKFSVPAVLAGQCQRAEPLPQHVDRLSDRIGVLISPSKIERPGHVPTAPDGFAGEAVGHPEFIECRRIVDRIVVRHDQYAVVRHANGDVTPSLRDLDHERLVRVGDGVGAAARRIAPSIDQLHQDVDRVPRADRPLGHGAAKVVADAAGLPGAVLARLHAAVADDADAALIVKHIGGAHAALRRTDFRPVESQRPLHLRNCRQPRLGGHRAALGPARRRHQPVADGHDAGVVLVVRDQHAPRRRSAAPGHERHAVQFLIPAHRLQPPVYLRPRRGCPRGTAQHRTHFCASAIHGCPVR